MTFNGFNTIDTRHRDPVAVKGTKRDADRIRNWMTFTYAGETK